MYTLVEYLLMVSLPRISWREHLTLLVYVQYQLV